MVKTKNSMHYLNKIAFLLGAMSVSVTTSAWGQPAPALRAVISADAAPEAMSQLFAKLGASERTISVPGAAWLQLQFSEVRLGPDGVLTITAASGESQRFSQAQIDAWGGLSAVFNGSELRVSSRPGQGATEPVSASIKDIIIGLPASAVSGAEVVTPQPLRNLLGPDIKRFLPDDLRGLSKEGAAPRQGAGTEAICGPTDDRIASANPRVGRIMPIGCTGWLIDGGNLLTAGHCIGAATQTVEFNVPASQADGTTVAPPVRDQYRVISGSIVSQNGGVGNDWAVFRVLPNTQTGLMPAAAQGATFQLSNTDNPAQVRITGYGVDGPAPNFGAGGPLNTQNQTQQTHVGTLSQNTGGATSGVLRYDTDTQGGNSGSPVIVEGSNIAIGIHTHGGCTPAGGTNAGTSFRNAALWTAVVLAETRFVFSKWATNSPAAGWTFLTGNFAGDDRLDVVGYHPSNGTLWVGTNTGTSFSFNKFATVTPAAGWTFLTGNFAGDDRLDVVGYHPSNGTLWVGTNTGTSFSFNKFATITPAAGWTFLTGNFAGDGRLDVVGYHPSNGTLWVGTNTGTSFSFNKFATITPAAGWTFLTGNFAGDGRLDVVGYHPSNGTLWVGTNTGSSFSFSKFATVTPAAGWTFLTGDFAGDGRLDVVGYHPSNGTLWVGTNTGSSFSFNKFATVTPAAQWTFLTGDFAGDGRLDVVGYHPSNGTLWVGTNTGSSFSFNKFATVTPAAQWTFLTGNFAGDGKPDVVGYHPSNGTLWVGTSTP